MATALRMRLNIDSPKSARRGTSLSPFAKGLHPHPPQFATHGVDDDPEGVSFWQIKHGIR